MLFKYEGEKVNLIYDRIQVHKKMKRDLADMSVAVSKQVKDMSEEIRRTNDIEVRDILRTAVKDGSND